MKRKLIFLDIDGTLTPAGSNTPPESAMKAIKAAQKNGHLIFLCTGRNPAMLAPVLALGFEGAVAAAGGYVFWGDRVLYDCRSGRRYAKPTCASCVKRSLPISWATRTPRSETAIRRTALHFAGSSFL